MKIAASFKDALLVAEQHCQEWLFTGSGKSFKLRELEEIAGEYDAKTPLGELDFLVITDDGSIGLMYAVTVWNDYSTVKIYITDPDQVNFQYKLRNMVMDGDTPTTQYNVSQSTLYNAGIVSAILPFMILYPFLQKYFVQGVNIGAVKE